jgi:peptidoglycan/LPS O-acetylase OafA/YrhL
LTRVKSGISSAVQIEKNQMKTLLIILIALSSCTAALLIILSVSYLKYETPSMEDAIGFGGMLLFAGIFLIPICYLPTIHLVQKAKPNIPRFLIILGLIIVGNIPCYIFLWIGRSHLGYGENYLFMIGFVVMAMVFGLVYPLDKKRLLNEK